MPDSGPSGVGVRRRRTTTTIFLVVGLALLLPLILIAAGLAALSMAFSNLDFTNHRTHLEPIPISAGACPYVNGMHQAASNYQNVYPFPFVLGIDANGRPLAWPAARTRIENAVDVLEYSIIVSSPHFPEQIRRYLARVRRDLDAGRAQLRAARDDTDLIERVGALQGDGQQAFGLASDLIGTQCGVTLGV